MTERTPLPALGRQLDEITAELVTRQPDKVRAHWSRAFRPPNDVHELAARAYAMYLDDNGFFSLVSPVFGDVENAVLDMATSLFNPTPDSCATSTSGGSESVFAGLHAAREWARVHKPEVTSPKIVVPFSAHPSFTKMSHYLGLRVERTAIDAEFRADVEAMAAAIDEDTICLVGSAPCWWYSRYDPIAAIGELAERHDIWLHVDGCLGGYLSPFAERLGYPIPTWDFRVPGVCSISADLHKYGYCPKPYSTVIWRSRDLLEYHHVHPEAGPAGAYRMMGFNGSRNAGAIFAAWSVMSYLGEEGYLRLARLVFDARQRIMDGVAAINGLEIPWQPELLPLPIGPTDRLDLGRVATGMKELGWWTFGMREPPAIHVPVDAATDDRIVETYLGDLAAVTAQVREGAIQISGDLRYG